MTFTQTDIKKYCNQLAKQEPVFKKLIKQYDYPPFYHRPQGFATLIWIVLEQQVSLASAKAAYLKLKAKIGTVTPVKLLALTDVELRECYFSRQKITYTKALATAILTKSLNLKSFANKTTEQIRDELTAIKGIGNWTAEVYLMMCLQHKDLFPIGDIALINSVKYEFALPASTSKEAILALSEQWQPHRTLAAFMLWNAYIQRKGIKL